MAQLGQLGVSSDIRNMVCGQKRLTKLRKRTAGESARVLAVTGLPVAAFAYTWAYSESDKVWAWLQPMDTWTPGPKTLHVAAKRAGQALCRGALWTFLPIAVAMTKMKQWGAGVFKQGPVHSIVLLLALTLSIVGTICTGIYVKYVYATLHFKYKVVPGTGPCISEDLTSEDLKKPNPGLAKNKAAHFEAVLEHLQTFAKGGDVAPDEIKVHVRVAARNVLAKTLAWKKMYAVVNWTLLVIVSLIALACAATLAPILRTAKTDPKWLVKCPVIILGTAVATLVVSCMAVVVKQRAQQEDKVASDFVTLASSFLACKDPEKCKASAAGFKRVPTRLSARLPGGASSTYSIRVLAATTVVAAIGFLFVFIAAAKPIRVARGVRALQSQELQAYLRMDGSGMSGGSALVDASEFRDRMKSIGDLIGDVPRSHVALWSVMLSMVSGVMLYTAWRDVLQSVNL